MLRRLALVTITLLLASSLGATTITPPSRDFDPTMGTWLPPHVCQSFIYASFIPTPPNIGNPYCTVCTSGYDACLRCVDRVFSLYGEEAAFQNLYYCFYWYSFGNSSPLQR